ncbi:uncharacterized protein F5Z01DRAFT_640815 [Emericellopsis atlantica]|uniref:Uncharacterized protein n=1 Tax=Emericellopsis atlantica TaxID=2614577 RepID=A0A9P7ZE81_9HYPO|nr:uncharacterized protein F5Z01DRAFT_640815 [Emericellopsis atlantica]KAG9249843.1 hypothetical protein F5Z01DRAFT_640815 [Emericellopsis atlantica]
MGNICGKEKSDNFTSPGRTVGTAPPQNAAPKASVPKKAAKVTGPGRTLGGSVGSGSTPSTEGQQTPEEARRRAAEAAEARAAGASRGGKLQAQLDAQKKQSRTDALKEASKQELARREADDATQAKNWD